MTRRIVLYYVYSSYRGVRIMNFNRRHTFVVPLAVAALALAACSPAPRISPVSGDPESGEYSVDPVFQPFYQAHGGLGVLGQGIGPLVEEEGIQVQYLLTARLEYHPGNPPESQVILSPLGLTLGVDQPPVSPPEDPQIKYFDATGHSLYPEFEGLFNRLGGLAFFGYPITEVTLEGDRLIQYFERAVLLKPKDSAWGSDVRLGALGYAAYPVEAGFEMHPLASIDLPPVRTIQQPFLPFLQTHSAADIVGEPLTAPYTADDGRQEQVYENSVIYADPESAGGARLRPLGLIHHPADPPSPPDPHGLYFPETEHNVMYAFAEYYQAHGGRDFFGLPLTEQLLEGDMLVQYFENARLEWHFDLPEELALRLAPYGRELLPESAPIAPLPAPNPDLPLRLEVWAESPVLDLGALQTVHVLVLDSDDEPLPDATALLSVQPSQGKFTVYMPLTDEAGRAQLTFRLDDLKAGEFVLYEVAVTAAGHPPAFFSDSFLTWYSKARPR